MATNTNKNGELGTAPIPKLVLRFSATTLAALLLNSVYTLTDALFVSWGVGDNAMGGVSVVYAFVVLQGAIASAVGSGAASIVSRKLGEGKLQQAGQATANAMFTFYSTAIVTSLLGLLLLEPLLQMMGVTGELLPHARQYFVILLIGNVFSTGFSNIIRAEGKMVYSLLIWVIPISLNIVLDAVFILVLGWGVAGSALATVLGQFTSFCMSMLFFKKYSVQVFAGVKISLHSIGEILAIGLPSLIQMGSLSVMSAFLNNILGGVSGTLGVNTFAYISKLLTFALVPFTAAAQAIAPIAGYNYGTGNWERVKKAVKFTLLLSGIYAVCALLLLQLAPSALLRIFTTDAEIISLGTHALRIVCLALPFMPLPMLGGALFQAIGKKLWALLLYAANVAFMIPLVLLFANTVGIGGVWWAYVAASVLASLLAGGRLLVLRKTTAL